MQATAYVIRRVLVAVPVFIGITVLIFTLMQLTPGSALDFFLSANPEMSYIDPQRVEIIKHQLGLDRPVYVQYVIWLNGLLHGDFGISFATSRPIAQEIGARIGNTAILFLFSHAIGWSIAVLVGVLSAARPGALIDHFSRAIAMVGISMPAFWIGVMLILTFSVTVDIFPTGGSINPNVEYHSIFSYMGGRIYFLILPSVTIALRSMASIMRTTRAEMLDVLSKNYITTARAKGVNELKVHMSHALRNSLLPVVTLMGVSMGQVFAGAVLTETVFSWPGVGRYLVQSVHLRDYPAVMGVSVLIAVMVLLANLTADVVYAIINPKIRY